MSPTNIRHFLILLVLLGTSSAFGQASDPNVLENQDLAEARALLQAGRADTIREELRMTDAESAGFWPIYDEYHADIVIVRDRQTKVIAELFRRYRGATLSNEYAEKLIEDGFAIKFDLLEIQEDYVRKFRKVLPALKVARFYQLENKMDAHIDAQLALFVPLVEAT
jgi:hypothetical protein